jgi:hypothetical protein
MKITDWMCDLSVLHVACEGYSQNSKMYFYSASSSDFLKRHLHLRNRLLDQGYQKIRLIRSLKKSIFRYQDLVEIYSVSAETIINDAIHIAKIYKDKEVNKNVKNIFSSMCDVKLFLTFTSLNLVLLWRLFYLFCSSIVINTVIVTTGTFES